MLLKCSTDDKRVVSGKGKGKLSRIGGTGKLMMCNINLF